MCLHVDNVCNVCLYVYGHTHSVGTVAELPPPLDYSEPIQYSSGARIGNIVTYILCIVVRNTNSHPLELPVGTRRTAACLCFADGAVAQAYSISGGWATANTNDAPRGRCLQTLAWCSKLS
jgi:hypothetical protein